MDFEPIKRLTGKVACVFRLRVKTSDQHSAKNSTNSGSDACVAVIARRISILVFVVGLAAVGGCGRTPAESKGSPAVKVDVAKIIEQSINEWDEVTARLEAPETVDIQPRVSGQIDSVNFVDGNLVKKGDVLFKIDPRPFEAELHRLEAQLQQAKAAYARSNSEALRGERLRVNNAISTELADSRSTVAQESKAAVAAIQAQLDLAKLNLSFTNVTAPITGRVSRAEITAGNIVVADTTLLTSVVSTDKVYAYFDADERIFLKYQQLARDGKRGATTPVFMGLSNESDHSHLGQMNFIDNQVDPKTGTIRGRAIFDNKLGVYTPGLYARLQLVGSATYPAMLIRDEAVSTDLGKKFVLVVNKDNKAVYRSVELGPKLDGLRVVRTGLSKDDRIVVSGLQRVRPGVMIEPQNVPMANDQALAALQRQRQLFEDSNRATATSTLGANVTASPPRG